MSSQKKGIICSILAAFCYGFTPILARISYQGGANGYTMTFLRAFLALPILFAILKVKKIPLRLERRELGYILIFAVLSAATTILLYVSYSYIAVGMSTTLHFIYPMLVALGCVVFFKEKLSAAKLIALGLATVGVVLSMEYQAGGSLRGAVLALLSGVTCTGYIILLDKSGINQLHYFKLSFYVCLFMGLCAGGFSLAVGQLTLRLTGQAWLFAFLVAFFISVCALSLFQLGVRYAGATTVSVLSTFEPITSVVLGALILQEVMSWQKVLACGCIVAGILLLSLSQARQAARVEAHPDRG